MNKLILIPALALLAACGASHSTPTKEMKDPVNLGYITVDRDNLTTSVGVIKPEENAIVYSNIYEMIEGKCAGVVVDGNKVTIRGMGPGDPLFVVDGVPMTGGVGHISPVDVKSITVLKDAASCAMYGRRGANGVIIIDLK